jgi:GTP cyclohydrolase II
MLSFTTARLPTDVGEFQLCLYDSPDGKEHLAIVAGDVAHQENVLVRIHSECFTGDVLGSRRCDCGEQLQQALQRIAQEGAGVVVYLRQEGRGIGLRDKLRAYNLQDEGYDTVEANLMLGHAEDERDYTAAVAILHALHVRSVRLLTNNPTKIEGLQALGLPVVGREAIQPRQMTADNAAYLHTKVSRMRHLLTLDKIPYVNGHVPHSDPLADVQQGLAAIKKGRAAVTLSYAQTLDGTIARHAGQPFRISGEEAMRLTHGLRAGHDGVLVGLGTVVADDPRLTVRLVAGNQPRPIVLDSQLRLPLTAKVWQHPQRPLIATTAEAPAERQTALEAEGATVIRLPATADGRVSLPHLVQALPALGIHTLMVEGGAQVIGGFLAAQVVDWLVVTVGMQLVGGLAAVGRPLVHLPRLVPAHQRPFGADWVVWGKVVWEG